jgi:hypothetical protein
VENQSLREITEVFDIFCSPLKRRRRRARMTAKSETQIAACVARLRSLAEQQLKGG